jgi:hypothetical protein
LEKGGREGFLGRPFQTPQLIQINKTADENGRNEFKGDYCFRLLGAYSLPFLGVLQGLRGKKKSKEGSKK